MGASCNSCCPDVAAKNARENTMDSLNTTKIERLKREKYDDMKDESDEGDMDEDALDISTQYVIVIDEHQERKPNDFKQITLSQIDTGSLPQFDDVISDDDEKEESLDDLVESVSYDLDNDHDMGP